MKTKDWTIPFTRPVVPHELLSVGFTPLLSMVLSLRGIRTAAEAQALISGGEELLCDPMLMLDWCDTLIVLQNGQVGAMLYPRTDPVEALQSALAAVYGPLELVPVTDRTGRVRLALLPL